MARPPLAVGTHGDISYTWTTLNNGREVCTARCWFRAADGRLHRPARTRPTKAQAKADLKKAVVEKVNEVYGGEITPDTRIRAIAELWFANEIDLAVAEGRKSPKTGASYRSYLDVHILPALGELQAREAKTPRWEGLITAKRKDGAKDDVLRGIRTVSSAVCSYAVRHGAMDINPIREVGRLERAEQPKPPRALSDVERVDVFVALETDPKARELDLGRILKAMLATGKRVGEVLGCSGDDVLLDNPAKPRVRIAHRTTRVKGKGVLRRRMRGGPKGKPQILGIPQWSVSMFRELKLAAGEGPLFPDPFGRWRSTDSVTSPLRAVLDRAGFDWLTSHGMRDTVAEVLRAGGIPLKKIAAQLGQASTVITEKHYLEDHADNDEQVAVLEGMFAQ